MKKLFWYIRKFSRKFFWYISRATSPDNIKIYVQNTEQQGKIEGYEGIYTKNIVYKEILTSFMNDNQQNYQTDINTSLFEDEIYDVDHTIEESDDDEIDFEWINEKRFVVCIFLFLIHKYALLLICIYH